jgi:hypothetical protein
MWRQLLVGDGIVNPVAGENMSVNVVVQSGVVKSPALRYDANSRSEFRFTLVQTEQSPDGQKSWPFYLPCCAVGSAAERLAGELEEDMPIVVTSGKLCYRRRSTKLGEQSRLEILVWTVQLLSPALAGVPVDTASEPAVIPDPLDELSRRTVTKPRKPRYLKWRPESAN